MLLVLFIIFQSFLKGLSHEGTSLFETNKQTLISLFQSQDSTVQEIGLRDFFNFLLGLKKTKYNLNFIVSFEDFFNKFQRNRHNSSKKLSISSNFINYLKFYLENILSAKYYELDYFSVGKILKLFKKIEKFKDNCNSKTHLNTQVLDRIMVNNLRLMSNGKTSNYVRKKKKNRKKKTKHIKILQENQTRIVLV
jgi:hypothetical protein